MKRKRKCIEKRAYGTKGQIFTAIKEIRKKRGILLGYYECPLCLDFHLTKNKKAITQEVRNIFKPKRRKPNLIPIQDIIKDRMAEMYARLGLLKNMQGFSKQTRKRYMQKYYYSPIPLAEQKRLLATVNNSNFIKKTMR